MCRDMLHEAAMCSDMSPCLAASEVIMICKTNRLELDAVGCESLSLCCHTLVTEQRPSEVTQVGPITLTKSRSYIQGFKGVHSKTHDLWYRWYSPGLNFSPTINSPINTNSLSNTVGLSLRGLSTSMVEPSTYLYKLSAGTLKQPCFPPPWMHG